jgi:hypothetical protein
VGRLIGIYNADGGLRGEIAYLLGHMVGTAECALCDITHSPLRKKTAWKEMEARLADELGHEMVLRHRNETTEAEAKASAGREPCVLIEGDDGNLSMILDWNDLQASDGSVEVFERILRSKLLMY